MCDILVCNPRYFGIDYEINSWMDVKNIVSPERAMEQWHRLCNNLKHCGARLKYIEPHPSFPDMVFTANAGLVDSKRNTVILSNFKHEERRGEKELFKRWFLDNKYSVIELPKDINFEGQGDALFVGDTLFLGHGFRTDIESHSIIAEALEVDYISCELIDPYFYHLDTCFMPTVEGVLYYKDAFSKNSRDEMLNKFIDMGKKNSLLNIINVEAEHASEFICNSVRLGSSIVTPSPNISKYCCGYTKYICDLSEFMKSGGAAKCLTLKL